MRCPSTRTRFLAIASLAILRVLKKRAAHSHLSMRSRFIEFNEVSGITMLASGLKWRTFCRADYSMQVVVYRSSLKEGMYIYMGAETSLDSIPPAVMKQFGEPEKALAFDLSETRQLPNADAKEVLASIEAQGFYIQMPAETDVEAILARVSASTSVPKK